MFSEDLSSLCVSRIAIAQSNGVWQTYLVSSVVYGTNIRHVADDPFMRHVSLLCVLR
jgi:hypothetical protein